MDMLKVLQNHSSDIEDVEAFSEDIYEQRFSSLLQSQKDLFLRMKSKLKPITDDELSEIIIDIPLSLFTLAERLNKFRLELEVIKMNNKRRRREIIKSSDKKTASDRNEEANEKLAEDEFLEIVYSSVITRVENEISYTRELIMGAKKVWDSRRKSEQSNPVGAVVSPSEQSVLQDKELPYYAADYVKTTSSKTPILG